MKSNHPKTLLLMLLLSCANLTFAQQTNTKPTVQDLDFLVGKWNLTFDFYDPQHPEKGLWFTEEGTMTCQYDLLYNGVARFITCTGELFCNEGRFKGRKRAFRSSIRYGNFVDTYERIGIFSNWPGTAKELLYYHETDRKLEIKGELTVREGIERYEDIYLFNEDYTTYTRRNVANFPDMPVTQYNLTFESKGTKVKE